MLDSLVSRCRWAKRDEVVAEEKLMRLVYCPGRSRSPQCLEGDEECRGLGFGARADPQVARDTDVANEDAFRHQGLEGGSGVLDPR